MPDVYTTIAEQPDSVVDQLAAAMELRAADPRQQEFVTDYLQRLTLPSGATAIEIGCGTGAIARMIAAHHAIERVVGIDPSPGLIARARELSADRPSIVYHIADGGATPLEAASADAVVLHTVLSHAPQPEVLLVEAHRLLRSGGNVVVFDGDYATLTFALSPNDPLELCAAAFRDAYINDAYVMRRAASMLKRVGFAIEEVRSAGYAQVDAPEYLLSVLDRGADALVNSGPMGTETVASLKDEARRRIADGIFFGFVAYVTVIGRRS